MSDDELLARYSVQAIRAGAALLGVPPLALAKSLRDGEIARLAQLLNAAYPQMAEPGLRHRTEDVLSAVTDGQMPMFVRPESELDFAIRTLRTRRRRAPGGDGEADGEAD